MAAKPQITPQSATVTAKWDQPTGLVVKFADHLHVQRVGDQYFLTLGQAQFPLAEGNATGDIEIPIRPLERYAVSESDLRQFRDAIDRLLPVKADR